jgi:hypothetical protein
MCRRLGLGHWNQVSFLAIADFASGSPGERGGANDQTGSSTLALRQPAMLQLDTEFVGLANHRSAGGR